MDNAQRRIADKVLSSRRMSGATLEESQVIPGPFNAWMQAPDLAQLLEPLGDHLRFGTSLPTRLSEIAILVTARHWDAQFEWFMHSKIAIREGLSREAIDDIAAFREPSGLSEDEQAVFTFCAEMRRNRTVSDATFAAAVAMIGHRGVVELMAVSGYYDLVSMTLNVAQVGLPDGVATPLAARTSGD